MSPTGEIKLHVGLQTFACLKADLCERSEYFRAMFMNEFLERNQEEIVLNDVDDKALDFILKKNTLDDFVDFDLIMDILKVSTMLQFNKDTEEYERYIITSDFLMKRPLPIMVVSFILCRNRLYRKAYAYCLWNFNELKYTDDFLDLPFREVIKYLDDTGLCIDDEFEVFEAIKLWCDHNTPTDENIISLIKTIRFKSLNLTDFEKICNTPFVKKIDMSKIWPIPNSTKSSFLENTSCLVDNHLCKNDEDTIPNELLNKNPRVYPGIPSIIIHKNDNFPSLYNFRGDKLKHVIAFTERPFTKAFVGFRMISIGFKIYLFGGKDGFGNGPFNTEVWSYDLISETYDFESTMLQQRRHFFISSFDEWVFILGGIGKHRKVLDNIEKYNIDTKEWVSCTDFNKKTIEAVCSYNKKIYIASRIIYAYNPISNNFETINIDLPIHGVSFITIHRCNSREFLYAVGTEDSNIYRWDLNSTDPYEYLGKFMKNGESLFLNNCIYHLSCEELDNLIWIQKFNINTFEMITVQLDNDIGEFKCKGNGFFKIPSYF